MNDLEQALAALHRRVEALEEENARLRQGSALSQAAGKTSRRHVLAAGVGAVGALAGGALLGHATPVIAAAPAEVIPANTTGHAQSVPLSLTVTLEPVMTRRAVWADHEWEFGAHFRGATPPVVVATAYDDYMEHDATTACTCAVIVRGTPGAYSAHIMVRNVSRSARTVVINAVALGH